MEQMITAIEVKNIALARKNYDESVFKQSVIEAVEKKFIKPLVGKDLYNEIRTQYKADNLNADNKDLVNNYLKPALAYYIVYLCAPTMMVDISSVGMQLNNTEFSNPISSSLRSEVGVSVLSIAQTFSDEATEFLEEQYAAGKYPLYDTCENVENNTSVIGGIILDEE